MAVTLNNGDYSAIISTFGAELIAFNKKGKNYIWTKDEKYWNKTSPVLFPIVGQLKNNSYQINSNNYKMFRHGFARDFEFEIINQTENVVTLLLTENQETYRNYPFKFDLNICYTLHESELKIEYIVKNESQIKMPFSIGAHPAIALNYDIENYDLQFIDDDFLENYKLQNGLLSDKKEQIVLHKNMLNLNNELFKDDALVFKKIKSTSVTILENNKPYLRIQLEKFPNLGIWTKNNAPFLCLEPWFGYADTVHANGNIYEKEGIQILEPNATFKTHFSLEIL